MKNLTKKISFAATVLSIAVMSMPFTALATTAATATSETSEAEAVVNPVVNLINTLLNPLLALVGAGGLLFCVFLGVKYARADDPQEHEKAKKALKNAIVGFVLIFVLMLALRILMPRLTTWVDKWAK